MKNIITILKQEYSKFIISSKNQKFVYDLLEALKEENIDSLVDAIKKDELDKDGGNIFNNLLTLQPFSFPIIENFIENNYFAGDNDFYVRVDKTMQISSHILEKLQNQKRRIRTDSTDDNLRSSEKQLLEVITELNKQKEILTIIANKKRQNDLLQKVKDEINTIESSFDETDMLDLKSEIYRKLDKNFRNLKNDYDNINEEKIQLEIDGEKLANLKDELFFKLIECGEEKKSLDDNIKNLKKVNKTFEDKYNFITSILSAKKSDNEYLREFQSLFNNEFLPFANKESSLADEADAVLIMQSIEGELKIIADCSHIYGKSIVAIGGGFSAGKTEFVSSFFKNKDVKLPIGINPVTAIPTYIINGKSSVIKGFSNNGGIVNLNIEEYKQLSHDFIKSLGFNLKSIMPMMAIETPIKFYDNICFIDTPGYNSAATDDGFTSEDKKCALEYLEEANGLIWMIGLDSNGTIPATDLDFLEELELENKELYIVLNKADLKGSNSSQDIITKIAKTLDDHDIDFEGISAYSSINQEEYCSEGKSLYDFLKKQNSVKNLRQSITNKLNAVIKMYIDALTKNIKDNNKIKGALDNLNYDLMGAGNVNIPYQFEEHISDLKISFNSSVLEDQKERILQIGREMEQAITNIFKNVK